MQYENALLIIGIILSFISLVESEPLCYSWFPYKYMDTKEDTCYHADENSGDKVVSGVLSVIECSVECHRIDCQSASYDSELKKCVLSKKSEPASQYSAPTCNSMAKNLEATVSQHFVAYYPMNAKYKGTNLGSGGSELNIINQETGVTYHTNEVEFVSSSTNMHVVGMHTKVTGAFTVSFWVHDGTNTDYSPYLESYSESPPDKGSFHMWHFNAQNIYVNAADEVNYVNHVTESNPSVVAINNWNFISYVHNTAEGKGYLYVNATEVSGYQTRNTLTSESLMGRVMQVFSIMPRRAGTSLGDKYFTGKVKCLSIAAKVLTASELNELMTFCP